MGQLRLAGELPDWVAEGGGGGGGGGGHQIERVYDTSGYKSTTSSSWVDMDATNLSITMTTGASWVLIGLIGTDQSGCASMHSFYDFTVDGTRQGQTYGLAERWWPENGLREVFSLLHVVQVSAGEHTFRPQWKVNLSSKSIYFYADSAYSPALFFVIEMS